MRVGGGTTLLVTDLVRPAVSRDLLRVAVFECDCNVADSSEELVVLIDMDGSVTDTFGGVRVGEKYVFDPEDDLVKDVVMLLLVLPLVIVDVFVRESGRVGLCVLDIDLATDCEAVVDNVF